MSAPSTPGSAGHLLIVNPNTNVATTALMESIALDRVRGTGLTVRSATAAAGPAMITEPGALAASVPHVLAAAHGALTPETRGIVVAAIGDPGVAVLRSEVAVPVIGIGEASVRTASAGGRRFGMATSTGDLVPSLLELMARHAPAEQLAGLRLTSTAASALAQDPEQQYLELLAAVEELHSIDGAEAVIIGGGPLSGSAQRIAAATSIAIVEPIPSAVALLLAQLGIAAPAPSTNQGPAGAVVDRNPAGAVDPHNARLARN